MYISHQLPKIIQSQVQYTPVRESWKFLFYKIIITKLSQKFCNILIYASFWCIYQVTKAVEAVVATYWGC